MPVFNVRPGHKLVPVSIDTAQWLASQGRRVMGIANRRWKGARFFVEVPE